MDDEIDYKKSYEKMVVLEKLQRLNRAYLEILIKELNQDLICCFEHRRAIDGLSQCLGDAADAVDSERNKMSGDRWLANGSPFLNGLSDSPKASGGAKLKK